MKIYKSIQKLPGNHAMCKIVVRIKRCERIVVSTGVKIPEIQWSPTLAQVIGKNARILNNAIDTKRIEVVKIAKEIEALPEDQQRNALVDALAIMNGKIPKTKTIVYFNEYCRKKLNEARDITVGTFKNHQKILGHMDRICPKCRFADINIAFVETIIRFCAQKKYTVETSYNVHKTIRSYLSKAILDGFFPSDPVKNPYNHVKLKRERQTTRCFLTLNEIEGLQSAALPTYLEIYRDTFVFLCYTGLRISDFKQINQAMINRDMLIVQPQKTSGFGTVVHLPIKQLFGGKPYAIWEKYNFDFQLNKHFDLELNRNIKLIANMIGIEKKLTCHVARHNGFCLSLNVSDL